MASSCPYMSCCRDDDDSDTGSIYGWAICGMCMLSFNRIAALVVYYNRWTSVDYWPVTAKLGEVHLTPPSLL